jgi:hypothetical protein
MEVKPTRTRRFFHRYTERAFLVAVAVLGTLVIGAPANAAPRAALQTTDFIAPASTRTTLAVSPVSPVAQGSRVTLTATITPPTTVGTVQFKDGTTNLGSPVTDSNNGTASGSISMLAPGPHQLTAVFTPANLAAFSTSTSQTVTFVVAGQNNAVQQNNAGQNNAGNPAERGGLQLLNPGQNNPGQQQQNPGQQQPNAGQNNARPPTTVTDKPSGPPPIGSWPSGLPPIGPLPTLPAAPSP